jgi:hypothetical protein
MRRVNPKNKIKKLLTQMPRYEIIYLTTGGTMNKTEWKALYSQFREARFNFRCYMERNNFPCGHDDMLYERFNDGEQDFIDQHPVLKQVLFIMDSDDELACRDWLLHDLYPEVRQRRLIERMSWQRDDRMGVAS